MSIHKLTSIIFLWLCFLLPNQVVAQNVKSEFNFDSDYQGEEIIGESDNTKLIYDPFETINRKVFAFNEVVDKNVALPIVKQYRRFIPDVVRKSVRNFVNNISAPYSIVNSILQGDGENSMASFSSFLINTTLGVGGLFDVAGNKKIKYQQEDFGQTLGKYGSAAGPYLVVPILGPSNLRDFSSFVAEAAVNPLSFNALEVGGSKDLINDELLVSLALIQGIDARERLVGTVDDIRKNSFDIYATMRSAYLQRRESLILNKTNP